jgi:calcium-dependent protein kinase
MLNKDPQARFSAKDCLSHSWFSLKSTKSQILNDKTNLVSNNEKTIYQMLKTYRSGAKFKKEVTKVLIN